MQDTGVIEAKKELDGLFEKLSYVTECMEHNKRKICDRKTEGFIHATVLRFISEATPNYEPRTCSIRARLAYFHNDIKATFLTSKGLVGILKTTAKVLVGILKVTGAVLMIAASFALINAVFVGFVCGLVALGLPAIIFIMISPLLIALGGLSLANSLQVVGCLICGFIDKLFEQKEENEPLLETLNEMAQCLTTDGYPDKSPLIKLIVKMSDNSFLSDDPEYNDIKNKLIIYLKNNPEIIHDLTRISLEYDHASLQDMLGVINTHEHLSLKQVNAYNELVPRLPA